jgi:tetratricopeptide (TPR) repeat protein
MLTRAVSFPLDERAWIVVPFHNLTGAADIDWLRRASINLLYLNLSQWRDVRAIDADRVTEILSEVPEASGRGPLSVAIGSGIARRAGAGKLVMGEYLKAGNQTTITVRLIDVRTGARIRSVTENATSLDSILPAYGLLARKLLDLPSSVTASPTALGTTRIDAFQEYAAGTQAFRRYSLVEARRNFERALELDSTFALAHYKLAQVIDWYDSSDSLTVRARVADAQRLGTNLPVRERGLIKALAAETRNRYVEACDAYAELLRSDSLDVDALFGLGHCQSLDNSIEFGTPGDTASLRFHSNWNSALRALRRVIELDPTNHIAFDDIVRLLSTEVRGGCRLREGSSSCVEKSARGAIVRRSGDTLIVVPASDTVLRRHATEANSADTRRTNLELARQLAYAWTELAPRESRARVRLVGVLLRQGRIAEAERELAKVTMASLADAPSQRLALMARVEVAMKTWKWSEAGRLVDSMSRAVERSIRNTANYSFAPALGRLRVMDSTIDAATANAMPTMRGAPKQLVRIILGETTDTAAVMESRLYFGLSMAALAVNSHLGGYETFAFGLRVPRKIWPIFDDARSDDPRAGVVVAVARKDSLAIRTRAAQLDSIGSALVRSSTPDTGSALMAAEAHMILADSANALNSLRRFLDSALVVTPYSTTLTPPNGISVIILGPSIAGFLWPRAMLLRGELAMALGHKDEARTWLQRFVDAWSGADAEFQPKVSRARSALAALGPASSR